jgi:hypothetical protein
MSGTLEAYAQSYLAGNSVSATREVERQGVHGRSWRFSSPDSGTRYSLLLLLEEARVFGLYSQGQAGPFDEQLPLVEEMQDSLVAERAAYYKPYGNDRFGFTLRTPPSWSQTRTFSGGEAYLVQFSSPPVGLERDQTLHASLTLNVEASRGDGSAESFYRSAQETIGEAHRIISHAPWRGGYADLTRQETPVAVSRAKRFYLAGGGRGYTLSCEARDDVFHTVSRWCDAIAETLTLDSRTPATR